jgi:hypothetical protein
MLEASKTAPVAMLKMNPQRLVSSFLEHHRRKTSYNGDSDIVHTAEHEIPTNDKVLLLVSRTLNDKSSLPGHVYRYLIEAFEDRCRLRQAILESYNSIQAMSPRARRDDAHAVIKHVTATLLEIRPEFGASAQLTELTATAVEGLVFGRLYHAVFEEIVQETKEQDEVLLTKIQTLQQEQLDDDEKSAAQPSLTSYMLSDMLISQPALTSLRMLPNAHSAVDKLHYCVRFLELISEQQLDSNVSADSLLKMVCQHLILHMMLQQQQSNNTKNNTLVAPGMNAQVAFLEEFARDEQLLRGREGYALVTLQASLHFLNMSTISDLKHEIFGQDDDDDVDVEVEDDKTVEIEDEKDDWTGHGVEDDDNNNNDDSKDSNYMVEDDNKNAIEESNYMVVESSKEDVRPILKPQQEQHKNY